MRLLLNALAAALGPLTHDDLAAHHPDLGGGLLLKRLTQDVNRWLVGDGKTQGYTYSHPRLGYFFWKQLSRQEQTAWDSRFCAWGAAILAALNAEQLDPRAAPVYLLRHYANHLHSISYEDYRITALCKFAQYLPQREREKVIHKVLTAEPPSKDENDRISGLSVLVKFLPNEMLRQALFAALSLGHGNCHDALITLAPRLADWTSIQPQSAYSTFADALSALAIHPRPEFLENLAPLMPFILALAGDEAPQAAEGIFHAIQEVCGWWP